MSSTTPNLGLTKTTAAETIGQNWAASNDSGGNFDIIDGKMGPVGNTSLQAQINALNSNLGESKIYRISKTVTIPAGSATTPGELEVDFASDIGNSSIWAVMCTLNSSVLPYVNNAGVVKTWVKLLSGSPTTKILIYNTDSAWTNYTLYTVLICRA